MKRKFCNSEIVPTKRDSTERLWRRMTRILRDLHLDSLDQLDIMHHISDLNALLTEWSTVYSGDSESLSLDISDIFKNSKLDLKIPFDRDLLPYMVQNRCYETCKDIKWETKHVCNSKTLLLQPYMMFVSGSVVLKGMNGERLIGKCNFNSNVKIPLRIDPDAETEDVIEKSCSCLVPPFKSSSASMMLHQTAALAIINSLLDCKVELESNDPNAPDIILQYSGITYNMDICSQAEMKIRTMSARGMRNSIAISKYHLLSCHDGCLDYLYEQSEINDHDPVSYITQMSCNSSLRHGLDSTFRKATLHFFVNKTDPRNRSIEDHEAILNDLLCQRIEPLMNRHVIADPSSIRVENIQIHGRKLLGSLDNWENKRESDIYAYPPVDDCELARYDLNELREYLRSPVPKISAGSIIRNSDFNMEVVEVNSEPRDREDGHQLFTRIKKVTAHFKTLLAAENYTSSKNLKNIRQSFAISLALQHFTPNQVVKNAMSQRVSAMSSLIWNHKTSSCYMKMRTTRADDNMLGAEPMQSPVWQVSSLFYTEPLRIDPDHLKLLSDFKVSGESILMLARSRLYHESRFRAKVTQAINSNYKPNSRFRVHHWIDDRITAEVIIRGLLFSQDGGVAIVSFFFNSHLYRTEKWRLVDVEDNKTKFHKIAGLLISIDKMSIGFDKKKNLFTVSSVILYESSWSTSIFLKAFRFYSYGVKCGSPTVEKCFLKMMSIIDKSMKKKLSLYLIGKLLERKQEHVPGLTPVFSLTDETMTHELFLVNLCPHRTYGRYKHLKDTVVDLMSEIILYDSNYSLVKDLHDDFEHLLYSQDLRASYIQHLKKLDDLSQMTNGRFTFSPIAIVMINRSLSKLKISYRSLQQTAPSLVDLMTARASHNSSKMIPGLAVETITDLSNELGTKSTSVMALKIIHKRLPDMSMRLFDKAQTGGNREISILSNEYRILQSILEHFCRSLCRVTSNEMLIKKDKDSIFVDCATKALKSEHFFSLSIDQTRWGPNFNTVMFLYMLSLVSNQTTENYIPMLACAAAEFKIFETPPWIVETHKYCNSLGSVIGRVGRSHMGQGIFHYCSSFFHSLVTDYIQYMSRNYVRKKMSLDISFISHYQSSFVTSDDCTIIETCQSLPRRELVKVCSSQNISIPDEDNIESMKARCTELVYEFYSTYEYIVKYFALKTSDYKNIISSKNVEFNSLYVTKSIICKNDIKFIGNLIEPITSGNFYVDYTNSLNSFFTAINSGSSVTGSLIISYMNYLRFCHDWYIRPDLVGIPNPGNIQHGIPRIFHPRESNSAFCLKGRSSLHYKTRNLLHVALKKFGSIGDMLSKYQVDMIHGSRSETAYRSIKTHFKGQSYIMNDSSYLESTGAVKISFATVVKLLNESPLTIHQLVDPTQEHVYSTNQIHRIIDKNCRSAIVVFKTGSAKNHTKWELLSSMYQRQDSMSSGSIEDNNLIPHVLRSHWKGPLNEDSELNDLKELSIEEKLDGVLKYIVEEHLSYSNCASRFTPSSLPFQSYTCTEHTYPRPKNVIDHSFVVKYPNNIRNYRPNYGMDVQYVGNLSITYDAECSSTPRVCPKVFIISGYNTVTIKKPTISEICKYLDCRLLHIDSQYRHKMGVTRCFLNMSTIQARSVAHEVEDVQECIQLASDLDNLSYQIPLDFAEDQLNFFQMLDSMTEQPAFYEPSQYQADQAMSMLNAPESKIISTEVDVRAFIYSDNYVRRQGTLNFLINSLIEQGVIYSDSSESGYILDDIQSKKINITVFDRSLAQNLNHMNRTTRTDLLCRYGESEFEWDELVRTLCYGEDITDGGNLKFKKPLIIPSKIVTVSSRPLGTEVDGEYFLDQYEDRLTA